MPLRKIIQQKPWRLNIFSYLCPPVKRKIAETLIKSSNTEDLKCLQYLN